ncbi:MAG: hypothetical protein V2A76_00660 [Planctomycetota bacterium]
MATRFPISADSASWKGGWSQVRRLILLTLVLTSLGGLAQAQTPLTGNIYDGSGGPLVSGTIYHASGTLTVPAGQTLTIPQNVIVKFANGSHVYVNGTLTVLGTAGEPVAFTALPDDDWGGDTNGDGPSTGRVNYWRGLDFSSTAGASTIEHAVFRWGGEAFWGALDIHDADISVTDCSFIQNGQSAIDLNGSGARPTVTDCSFVDNLGYVCTAMPLEAVTGFTNCTASGNGGNCLNVTTPSPSADLTITADNCVGGALLLNSQILIAAGITLTLEKGVILKMWNGGYLFTVQGTLLANGTVDEPVVFTAYHDDEYGGDTNGDGASSAWGNYWSGMIFNSTAGDSVLEHAVVRYAGYGYYDAITIQGADVTLRGCVLERNGQEALGLAGIIAHPTVEWCRFDDNGKYAVSDVPIEAVPYFRFNTATGNAMGSYVRITKTSPTEDIVLRPYNTLNGVHGFANHTIIPAGVTLDLAAGTIIKIMTAGSHGFEVHGSLNALGTAAEPVVITSYKNDNWGGDTNADGPSTGGWIDWSGIKFHADAQTSIMEHAVVSYNGYSYWNAVDVASPNVTLRFRVDGPAGSSTYMLGLLDGSTAMAPYGVIAAGTASLMSFATVSVGTDYILRIPRLPALIGAEFGIQTVTFSAGNPAVGGVTNLYRTAIGPSFDCPLVQRR